MSTDKRITEAPAPSEGLADELSDAAVGLGLFTVTLFGAVPGFPPIVALTIFAGALLLLPLLVVGLVVGLPLLLARIVSRLVAGTRHRAKGSQRCVRTEPRAALH